MKNLYISKELVKQGVTREEAWEIVDQFDKECILHPKYKSASLLQIPWMPGYCVTTPTSSAILVLIDVNGEKEIKLLYFYEDGIFCSDGKTRKFIYLFQLHPRKNRGSKDVERSLPVRLRKILK